jgi:hypothetical protein
LIGRTVTAGMPPSQADRLRDVVARALTWLALAGMALIAGGAAIQAARLVFATARRTSTGPGLAGLAIVTLFALLAALTVFAPYLVRRDRWSPRAWLGAGLLLTAAVRLVTVLLIDAPLTVDGADYRQIAIGIMNGICCFGDRSPGLPWLLAPGYALVGPVATVHELINLVAAVVGGWLLYRLVEQEWNGRAAASALGAYALMPSLALFTPVLLTEPVFTTVVLAMLWTVLRATRDPRPWTAAVGSGLLIAAAQYIRALGPLLLAGAVLMVALAVRRWPRAAGIAAVMVLAFAAGMLPMVAHNVRAHGAWSIATSSFGGNVVYIGTSRQNDGRISTRLLRRIDALPGADRWQRGEVAQRIGMRRLFRHPAGFVALAVRKFPIMWSNDEEGVRFALSRPALKRPLGGTLLLASQLAYACLTVMALIGLWIVRRRPPILVAGIAVLLLATIGLHTLIEVKPRYHYWLIPLFAVLAAPAIDAGSRRLGRLLRVRRGTRTDGNGDSDGQIEQVGTRRGMEHGAGERLDQRLDQHQEAAEREHAKHPAGVPAGGSP